jgi:hypothetical protein
MLNTGDEPIVVEGITLKYFDPTITIEEPVQRSSLSQSTLQSKSDKDDTVNILSQKGQYGVTEDNNEEEDNDTTTTDSTAQMETKIKHRFHHVLNKHHGQVDLLALIAYETSIHNIDTEQSDICPLIKMPSLETMYMIDMRIRVLRTVPNLQFWEMISSFSSTSAYMTNVGTLNPRSSDISDDTSVYIIRIPAKRVQHFIYSRTRVDLRLESDKKEIYKISFMYEVQNRPNIVFELASEVGGTVIRKTRSLSRILSFGKLK